MSDIERLAGAAREAAAALAVMTTDQKNVALRAMADGLEQEAERILAENRKDLAAGKEQGLSSALMDRLELNGRRISEMSEGLVEVAALRDPVGEVMEGWRLPNGLEVEKVRVPLGVVGIIYEARPNVTVDAAGLCIKSGNAVILRGSSSAINSNRALAGVLSEAAVESGLPGGCVQLVDSVDREAAMEMMRLHGAIDVLIPRGGEGLIRTVVESSTVPVIETGVGNCHIYVDDHADLEMALEILDNAKTQRPGVCNAVETLLVHRAVAPEFLLKAWDRLGAKGVTLKCDQEAREILPECDDATEEDWKTEYLDLTLAVKVVEDLGAAIAHINMFGTGHSDAIVTSDYGRAGRFTAEVDSAAVYVNASTRFTDGGQFGLGAEIGISTQKLHARGPMGLAELTSTKYIIRGSGQTRT
jgi:glutamate-5-semialdehyde dehydrogenase